MDAASLTQRQHDQLRQFVDLVHASPHNLVSRRAAGELWSRHVPEGLALANLLAARTGPLLDLGSGGGFPGVILAIAEPNRDTHLLDATAKKTRFLQEVAEVLGLPVTVHTGRAEEVSRGTLARRFATVTARAVAPLERLVPLAAPFLAGGGVLVAVKGASWSAELKRASGQLRANQLVPLATPEDLTLTYGGGEPLRVVMIGRRGTVLTLPERASRGPHDG